MPDEIKEALEEVNQLDSAIKTKAREATKKADEAKEAAVIAIRLSTAVCLLINGHTNTQQTL